MLYAFPSPARGVGKIFALIRGRGRRNDSKAVILTGEGMDFSNFVEQVTNKTLSRRVAPLIERELMQKFFQHLARERGNHITFSAL